MKLDLNAVWDQAIRLIGMNREVVLVLSGVFFFLPYVLFTLLIPMPEFAAAAGPRGEDTSAMMAAIDGFLRQYWWAMLILIVVQVMGALAVMAVLGDPARPTVGDAIGRGLRFLPTSLGAQIVLTVVIVVAIMAALILGAFTGSRALSATLAFMSLPLILWLSVRLSLANPVIAIEQTFSPLTPLRRSWHLTRGHGWRLFAFFALLLVAFVVVSQVASLAVMALTALLDATLAKVIGALLSGVVSSVLTLMIYAVLASLHRQLARAQRVSVPVSGEH